MHRLRSSEALERTNSNFRTPCRSPDKTLKLLYSLFAEVYQKTPRKHMKGSCCSEHLPRLQQAIVFLSRVKLHGDVLLLSSPRLPCLVVELRLSCCDFDHERG
jgi:hypothetical protein